MEDGRLARPAERGRPASTINRPSTPPRTGSGYEGIEGTDE